MKTKQLLFAVIIITGILFSQQANARVWRVNNISNFNGSTSFGDNVGGFDTNPVFSQIDNVMSWSSVVNGDTLHIEGATNNYNTATITKKLVIIGPGFYLNENPKVSINILEAKIYEIHFNTGSDGSQLIGISMSDVGSSGNRIYINVNNIVIKRCKILKSILLGSGTNNTSILQNFFTSTNDPNCFMTNGSSSYVYPSEVTFNQNICQKTLIWGGPISQCNNNVFDGPLNALNLQFSSGEFMNNILKPLNAGANINNGTNQNVRYNIGSSDNQFGTGSGNLVVIDMSTLFVNATAQSTDGKYQLKANSAGSNNGSDGTDRGAFGGNGDSNHYTLSGLAPIPVIYQITTSGIGTPVGLNVTIQARTIK